MLLWIITWVLCLGMPVESTPEKVVYGLEMQENLVGYIAFDVFSEKVDDKECVTFKAHTHALLSLLGQGFDLVADECYRVDAASGRVCYYDNKTSMGTVETGSTIVIEDGRALFTPRSGGDRLEIELTPDVIVNHPLYMPYLMRDLGSGEDASKAYLTFNLNDGKIHEITYTRVGPETVRLMDRDFQCLVFSWSDQFSGEHGKIWIEPDSGQFVKITQSSGVTLYLARPEVAAQIKRVDMDDTLFVKVDMPAVDYRLVSYLKVKAAIRAPGQPISVESLNVPGQRFEGVVEKNRIEGTFEVEHKRYGGEAAAPFPPDYSGLSALQKYLAPEDLIESDDESIVAKAKELTRGSIHAWDAVTRMSCWVSEEIVYEIPGGSARRTLATGKGECGSQSRLLTAMCRSVGIPARLVGGCMFTPYFGGSFGQHAWCEVYMGEAGWIPIDATAREPDFVDSTHIRLGELTAFNPESMEVLDFSLGSQGKGDKTEAAAKGEFSPVPWQQDRTAMFEYTFKDAPLEKDRFTSLGTDRFFVDKVVGDGPDAVVHGRSELSLQGRTGTTEWTMTRSGKPLTYQLKGKVGDTEYSVDCVFSDKEVKNDILQAGRPFEYAIPVPEKVYLVDNNNLGLFCFLMAGVPLEIGKTLSYEVYHVTSSQVLNLKVTAERRETILFEEKEVECTVCSLDLDGYPIKIWIDDKRRILKESEQNGRLVVKRTE